MTCKTMHVFTQLLRDHVEQCRTSKKHWNYFIIPRAFVQEIAKGQIVQMLQAALHFTGCNIKGGVAAYSILVQPEGYWLWVGVA